jgi:two-component system LytT family response regulator
MRCIAIDDEDLGLQLLKDNIGKVPFLELVACCGDAFEAMKVMEHVKIDLIFVDIQMPGLSGMDFIRSLTNKPLVIFVTAYKKFALESYDLSVVDYLVKPVSMDRFIKACNRAKDLFDLNAKRTQPVAYNPDYMFLNADYSQVKVLFSDIVYMEGLRDYVRIHLKKPALPLLIRTSLKALEPDLPEGKFIRFHKSYVCPVDSITAIRKNSLFIGNLELPVGDTYKDVIDRLIKRDH